MKSHNLLEFGATMNDLDSGLPKSRGDCFDVGIWGGCGVNCPVFQEGDCNEYNEFTKEEIEAEFDEEDILELKEYYPDAKFHQE